MGAVEKFSYLDAEGRYITCGGKIEVRAYAGDSNPYLIDAKSLLEEDIVEWISWRFRVASQVLGTPVAWRAVAVYATKEALKRPENYA